jgi:hypothetical protein
MLTCVRCTTVHSITVHAAVAHVYVSQTWQSHRAAISMGNSAATGPRSILQCQSTSAADGCQPNQHPSARVRSAAHAAVQQQAVCNTLKQCNLFSSAPA